MTSTTGITGSGSVSRTQALTQPVPAVAATAPITGTGSPSPAGPQGKPLVAATAGFAQNEAEVAWTVSMQNPDPDLAIVESGLSLTWYGPNDAALRRDDVRLPILLPGERALFSGVARLAKGEIAARVDVRPYTRQWKAAPAAQPLTTAMPRLITIGAARRATVIVHNPNPYGVARPRVSIVGYDGAGKVVTSGYTEVSHIAARGEVGTLVYLPGSGPVARLEAHAALRSTGPASPDDPYVPVALDITIPFTQRVGTRLAFGAEVRNSAPGTAYSSVVVHASVYDTDGSIAGAGDVFLGGLLPGQMVRGANFLELPASAAARVVLQATGEYATRLQPADPPLIENVKLQADPSYATVTGTIRNQRASALKAVSVHCILYDANGRVVGGSGRSISEVPPGGSVTFSVDVSTIAKAARAEAYAMPVNFGPYQ